MCRDREGDIAALMQCAQELGGPGDWLMRSQHNRALKGEACWWETMHSSDVFGHIPSCCLGAAIGRRVT